jgi:hypothetical protein
MAISRGREEKRALGGCGLFRKKIRGDGKAEGNNGGVGVQRILEAPVDVVVIVAINDGNNNKYRCQMIGIRRRRRDKHSLHN